MWITHTVGNDRGKLAGKPGEEYIPFRSSMIPGHSPGDTHVGFKMVNAPFHDDPDFTKRNPFIRIPLDTGKHTEVHVFVNISCAPLFSGAAGILPTAYPLPFYYVDFGQTHLSQSECPFSWQCPAYFMSR